MFGKPKAKSITASSSVRVKKAPPRPPPPSTHGIPRSSSMGLNPRKDPNPNKPIVRTQTVGCSYNITNRSDLIDLSSPSNSPPRSTFPSTFPGITSNEVADFKYHVGASIFYIKSELKSMPGSNKPTANPFSPPRPSPHSVLSNTPSKISSSTTKPPTIIKANTQTSEAQNNNNYGATSLTKAAPVLLDWDEPPKKTYVPPTVIRPIPPPKKPGLASLKLGEKNPVTSLSSFIPPPVTKPLWTDGLKKAEESVQPRYEEPPIESDDDFDFEDSFEMATVPEPSGPPPPPPQDLNDYRPNSTGYSLDANSQNYVRDSSDHAYGIALYDYSSGEPGDLNFAVGDVIYLTRLVDESWLYGSCGGAEGMFPSTFINIVVPLGVESQVSAESNSYDTISDSTDSYSGALSYPTHYVQVLHTFEASEPLDLNIQDGDIVTVIGRVNDDWLYGELHGQKGQFPASFIEYVPANLPQV